MPQWSHRRCWAGTNHHHRLVDTPYLNAMLALDTKLRKLIVDVSVIWVPGRNIPSEPAAAAEPASCGCG